MDAVLDRTKKAQTLRHLLEEELLERCRKNPQYSLRSFARSLGVDHTTLSRVLRGNRPIGRKLFIRLSHALNLSGPEIKHLSESLEGKAPTSIAYSSVALESMIAISDWYHDAILELTQTTDFKDDPKWIAKRLQITVSEVNVALERLLNLGFLERNAEGKICNSIGGNSYLPDGLTHPALIRLQKSLLKKSVDSLQNDPISKRDHTSVTLPMTPKDVPEVKKRIKKFRRELTEFLMRDKENFEEVYEMTFSLFPLTRG